MKAILCTAYGPADVLKLVDLPKPSPKADEVLVKVVASSVTFGDCEIRNLTLPAWTRLPVRMIMGYRKPKHLIPGMEVSGIVETVGAKVSQFKPGDAIFGSTGMAMGGNAEYICRPAKAFAKKPDAVSFEHAATITVGGINALHFLRMANIRAGQKVLVIGAGGSIGTWAVLLAKHYGAKVWAVDHNRKLDMLRSIGADHVVDYMQEDFSSNAIKYDVIFDAVYSSPYARCINSLTDSGYYLMANTGPGRMLKGVWTELVTRKKVKFALAAENEPDLSLLANLIAAGKIKPVIDRIYPLEQTMEAHRYVEQGLKKGSVIIDVALRDALDEKSRAQAENLYPA
ncbi:MAG TPA: NAD(P)-dependent alcohol dehydrogenase [Chryseosolibacter sp.]